MLKPEELSRFQLDPGVIEWKIYIANFICGIKRYVLKEPIMSNLKLEHMDLNWDLLASSSFSDIRWALERGSSTLTRRLKDIKSIVLNSSRVQNKILELANKDSNKTQQASIHNLNNESSKIMDSLFANVRVPVIQSMAWIFKKVWRSIFEQIVVDEGALTILQKFISSSKDPIVFVPSHRSYFDMIIVNYVLFAYNIKTPYTATSEKFLSVSLINKILRMTGGFFIENKNLKNELFLSILTEYMSLLLIDNQIIEFFIEGHRSRTGKIMHPRKELLSICTTPYFEGEVKDIIFVPITINYDRVIEGESLPLELLGEFKEKDSIWNLMQTFRVMKQNFGKVHISHSPPISLKQFSQGIEKNLILDRLAYEIMYRLQESSIVMPTSIVASVLLITRRTLGEDDLISQVEWVQDEVKNRGFKVSGLDKGGAQIAVKDSLALMNNLIVNRKDLFNNRIGISNDNKKILLLAYYRSFLHNVFILESLVTCTINSFGKTLAFDEGIPIARIIEESEFLTTFLKHEFECRDLSFGRKGIENILNLLKNRGFISEKEGLVTLSRTSGIAINFLCSFVWPIVDTYWSTLLFCSAICKDQSIQYEKLQLSLQWFVENLVEERTLGFYESCSRVWIKHSLQTWEEMGIIQVTGKTVREVRLEDRYVNNSILEEHVEHLGNFRKVPFIKKIGAMNELKRALLAEFPKL
jgi:glycerol-3-phosphate O-acyltransferase